MAGNSGNISIMMESFRKGSSSSGNQRHKNRCKKWGKDRVEIEGSMAFSWRIIWCFLKRYYDLECTSLFNYFSIYSSLNIQLID